MREAGLWSLVTSGIKGQPVFQAFHGRGEGGDGRGDGDAVHHGLGARLNLYALRTVSLLVK